MIHKICETRALTRARGRPTRIGFVGAGLIARYVHTYLTGTGWSFDRIGVYDSSADGPRGSATICSGSVSAAG